MFRTFIVVIILLVYMHMSKLIKMYTLNVCDFLYINSSVKQKWQTYVYPTDVIKSITIPYLNYV